MPLDSNSRTYASARLLRPSSMDVRTSWYAVVLSGRTLCCFIISNSLQGGRTDLKHGLRTAALQAHNEKVVQVPSRCTLYFCIRSISQQPCLLKNAILHGSTAGWQRQQERANAMAACSRLTVQTQEIIRHNRQCTGTVGKDSVTAAMQSLQWNGILLHRASTRRPPAAEMEVLKRLPSGLADQAAAGGMEAGLTDGPL